MMRRTVVLCAALGAAVVLSACGEKAEPSGQAPREQRLTLMLDAAPGPDHAGLYAAIADGELRRAALELTVRTPSDPAEPLKQLASGKVDLAIAHEADVLLARDRGEDVVSIGALIQRPLQAVVAVGTDTLRSGSDLSGKTVGTAGLAYQSAYLQTLANRAKANDVKPVDTGSDAVRTLLGKKADAALGTWNVDAVALRRRHKHASVLRLDENGVPAYDELVVVARVGEAHTRGALLRRFMQALSRGHRALRDDPAIGVDALLKAGDDLDKGLVEAAVDATLSSFFPSDRTKPFGWQSPSAWLSYTNWMVRHDLIKQPANPAKALTNEYLPGQGL